MVAEHHRMTPEMLSRHITPHFAYHELVRSGDNVPASCVLRMLPLCEQLEKLRAVYNRPIIIISGYRTLAHNTEVGGAKDSRHMHGDAADIYIPGIGMHDLYNAADKLFSGVGLYSTHVHVDMGPPGRRW